MSALFYVLSAVVLIAAIDATRRPAYQWAEADKDKTFWVIWLWIGVLISPAGIVFAVIYVTTIVPRMGGSRGTAYATYTPPNPVEAIDVHATVTTRPSRELYPSTSPPCASCGQPMRDRARFCASCGSAVVG